jgi:hypothetical protein
MNERLDLEIEKTIQALRSSMPSPKTSSSYFRLLQLAVCEVRPAYFVISMILTLLLSIIGTYIMSAPLLSSFCAAPVPILLIFCRYVWQDNKPMQELEQIFRYSFTQMLAARMLVLSVFCLLSLFALATIIYNMANSISFVRTVLCGFTSLTATSGILLLCADKARENELMMISTAIWLLVSFIAFYINADIILAGCSLILLFLVPALGVVFNVYGLIILRKRGISYAV